MLRAWGDDTVRGGQTVFHGLRMWSQLVRVGLLLTAALAVAVPAVQYLRTVPALSPLRRRHAHARRR